MENYYIIGVLFFSILVNYLSIKISHSKNLFIDTKEKPQKNHKDPTPRLGGLSIFLAFLISNYLFFRNDALLLAIIPTFLSGFLEDLSSKISPRTRLLFMLASAILAIVLLDAVVTDFDLFQVPMAVGVMITIVAIIGMTNGINIIDGFNGLAGAANLLIFANLFLISYVTQDVMYMRICATIFFAVLGFLVFNIPSGRIFLGDGGAYLLGILAALISILLYHNHHGQVSSWFFLLNLIYPVWEVIFSFFRRIYNGQKPLNPDGLHLHTLVFRNASFHRNSLVVVLIFPFLAAYSYLAYTFRGDSMALLLTVLSFAVLYSISYARLRRLDFNRKSQIKKIRFGLEQKL